MRPTIHQVIMDEPYPCQWCKWASNCKKYELACLRFIRYINEERWVNLQQQVPTGKYYQLAFHNDTDDLVKKSKERRGYGKK